MNFPILQRFETPISLSSIVIIAKMKIKQYELVHFFGKMKFNAPYTYAYKRNLK